MRLAFAGTPVFARVALEGLLEAGFEFATGLSGWDVVGKIRVSSGPLSAMKPLPLGPVVVKP